MLFHGLCRRCLSLFQGSCALFRELSPSSLSWCICQTITMHWVGSNLFSCILLCYGILKVAALQHMWAGLRFTESVKVFFGVSTPACLAGLFLYSFGYAYLPLRHSPGRQSLRASDPSWCSPALCNGSLLPSAHLSHFVKGLPVPALHEAEAQTGCSTAGAVQGATPFFVCTRSSALRRQPLLLGPSDVFPDGAQGMDTHSFGWSFLFMNYGLCDFF